MLEGCLGMAPASCNPLRADALLMRLLSWASSYPSHAPCHRVQWVHVNSTTLCDVITRTCHVALLVGCD